MNSLTYKKIQEINEIETQWETKAKRTLNPKQARAYGVEIKKLSVQLKNQLRIMNIGFSAKEIQEVAQAAILKLNQLAEQQFSQFKLLDAQRFNFENVDKKIQATQLSEAPLTWKGVLSNMERMEKREQMMDAAIMAGIAKGIEKVPEMAFQALAAAAEISPTYQLLVKPVVQCALEALPAAETVEKAIPPMAKAYLAALARNRKENNDKEVKDNEKLGIFETETRQYHDDQLHASKLALALVPLPCNLKAIKPGIVFESELKNVMSVASVKNFIKSEEGAIRIPSLKPKSSPAAKELNQVKEAMDTLLKESPPDSKLSKIFGANYTNKVEGAMPHFNNTGSMESGWLAALRIDPKVSKDILKVIPYQHNEGNVIKLEFNKKSFIIKTCINPESICYEFYNSLFLRSLNLKHMKIAEPKAIGQSGGMFFIAKTFLKGETFAELIKRMGAAPITSVYRQQLLNDLLLASGQAGKAFGELQTKKLKNSASQYQIENAIRRLEDIMDDIRMDLPPRMIQFPRFESKDMQIIIENFKKNPGPSCYGIGDIEASDFVWSSKNRSFGCFDVQFVNLSYDVSGTPQFLTMEEYYAFHALLDGGLDYGLQISETNLLKEAFSNGYRLEFKGKNSPAGDKFFDVLANVDVISALMKEEGMNVPIIQELNKNLRRKIREYSKNSEK